jgi:two-component system chemotaxis sensor kinase CheA
MDDLTREFLIESQEGLDRMERCLTDLEGRPEDGGLLAEIFRAVHTIKGTTGFLGFGRLEKLAHAGENLLGLLRDGKLKANPDIVTGLLALLDRLRAIVRAIEADGNDGGEAALPEDAGLIAMLEALQSAKPRPSAAEKPAKPPVRKKRVARAAASVKVAPRVAVEAPAAVAAEAEPAGAAEDPTPEAPVAEKPAPEKKAQPAEAAESTTSAGTAADSTLRVDVHLLNQMMNLVGELVLTRNQVLQATAADPRMTLLCRRLDMVTADLRESVMKARMQPVENVFAKIPRMVRDLQQALKKQVHLECEGRDTELDKSLLEAIKDPLMHAVRNALDHGIETPEVRAAAGKDPAGTLKVRAAHEGSHVIVEISDDGAGISVERIRQKAIERGIVTAERASHMTERELLQLIFVPGFSTAAQVTNVSGRGVGMDVVRTNVEKIGGKVEIDSRVGKGTTLRLRIPLTLAIIPALIVRSLGQSFAIPQGSLLELVHVPAEQNAQEIEWMENAPVYRLRGQLLPLVFLDRMLEPAREGAEARGDLFIAVLDADGRRFGLVVDALADPEEIVVKPLSAVLKEIGFYSGATVLGSADLALILDPGTIAARAGVRLREEDESDVTQDGSAVNAAKAEYLLVETAGRRAAVPLGQVLRIEQIQLSRIEYAGTQPVLNLAGQLLPVEDPGGLIGNSAEHAAIPVVVVCREGGRQAGIAVSRVLDVAAGDELFEAGTSVHAEGVTVLKGKVTRVVQPGSGTSDACALEESLAFTA